MLEISSVVLPKQDMKGHPPPPVWKGRGDTILFVTFYKINSKKKLFNLDVFALFQVSRVVCKGWVGERPMAGQTYIYARTTSSGKFTVNRAAQSHSKTAVGFIHCGLSLCFMQSILLWVTILRGQAKCTGDYRVVFANLGQTLRTENRPNGGTYCVEVSWNEAAPKMKKNPRIWGFLKY